MKKTKRYEDGGAVGDAARSARLKVKDKRPADERADENRRGRGAVANVVNEAISDVQDRTITPVRKGLERASVGYKKGGYVRAADGIAQRGKTRGRVI